MGYTAKKKKRGGGGGGKKNKGRTASKDHSSNLSDDNELLSEEITALCSIFQEDCRVVSDSPLQVDIKLRPYSKDMGYEDAEVSALLSVKYLPGYPYKSPKLLITPEKGLVKADVDKLLSLLYDQANFNAREGRVMIFNLVEAAQEFLSEIVPVVQSSKSVPCPATNASSPLFQTGMTDSSDKRGPFVYGYIDLFGGSGELWSWRFGMDEKSGLTSVVQRNSLDGSKFGNKFEEKKLDKNLKSLDGGDTQGQAFSPFTKLDTLEEESEGGNKSLASHSSRSLEELVDSGIEGEKQMKEKKEQECEKADKWLWMEKLSNKLGFDSKDHAKEEEDASDNEPSEWSFTSLGQDQVSQTVDKDLMMVHLLRLACAKKGPLADALPEIISELYNLGMLSDQALELASKPSSTFEKQFDHVFRQYRDSSHLSQFWKPAFDLGPPLQSSRYLNDFEELKSLGHGGFGHVVLCKNILDGRQYAVKKIRLKDKSLPDRILREVATLSRLQHHHVVRYYQAWFETGVFDSHGDTTYGSMTPENSSFSCIDSSATDMLGRENKTESTYLYIQMEYCPRTLRQVFESYRFDKELAWHLFRQIVEGLAHIHSQGIIHRDLTPNNIFFDARNDIKIGDFGLAKFLKLEQLDQDQSFPDTTGVSIDGTGQVGTYFYTAPEIEQGWPKIDEKADMYSLGIVFFELWHPFGTAMERHVVLSDLKQKIELPPAWVAEFPEQASLLKHLMSSSPTDRPSAQELLRHSLPPRMESELLDNVLRRMKTPEDSSVYDKVVHAIFDEEMLGMKDDQDRGEKLRLAVEDASSIQYNEVRDYAMEVAREVFRRQGAKHLEINPMHLLDECPQFNRNTVKLLTNGGDMIELCYELRIPFLGWVISNQKSSFKRYEVECVYRRAIGHSPPNRYLQGDYDIIGGAPALTEAEVIKGTMDIVSCFFHSNSCDIHLNHGDLLDAIWSWVGVKAENRHKVAELLSIMGSLRPQSSERKSKWVVIRRQLLQELNLAEAVVNRLQTVALRFSDSVDMALPRLRGALPSVNATRKALDELSDLYRHLTVWRINKNVYIDVLMPPTENYYRDLFFQIFLMKENHSGSHLEGSLLAVGGRYDYLLHQMWTRDYKTNPPGGVGTSIALETIIQQCPVDFKPIRNETGSTRVLVCAKGGGGLLAQRMELVAELWEENIKAEFVPAPDPSLTEQYEYANEHDIKCLVIITDTGVSFRDSVKVRHIELKKEKEIVGGDLAKFLLDAMASQFKNPSIWKENTDS